MGDCARWENSLRLGTWDNQSRRKEEIHLGLALLIYGNWETCRQKPVKLKGEVKVRTRDQEMSRTLSGCDKLRHGPPWLKLQGEQAARSGGLREELRETPLLKGQTEEGEPPR